MPARAHLRGLVASALVGLAGCSGLLGLDPKADTPSDAGAAEGGAARDDGAAAADEGGDARPRSQDGGVAIGVDADRDAVATDAGALDPDGGCSATGPVPDGASRTFYGSCVPHLTPNQGLCNAYGYTGALGATPTAIQIQKNVCATQKGTWTDGPCNLTGAVFGCENVSSSGFVCETISISWFYAPHTVADEASFCPPSVGTVVLP